MQKILVAFLALFAGVASAQTSITPGASSITSGGTSTSGCVAGGVLRSISNLVDCSAGLTYASGALSVSGATGTTVAATINNGTSTGNILNVQDNGSNVFTVADGGLATATRLRVGTATGSPSAYQLALGNAIAGWWDGGSGGWSYSFGGAAASFGLYPASGTSVGVTSTGTFGWAPGAIGAAAEDLILARDAAATLQLGLDVNGAAINQTIKAHDGVTGINISGANMTIAAGRGTGTGAGGTLAFQTAPVEASGTTAQTLVNRLTIPKTGGIQLVTASTKPTCDSAARGQLFYVAGGAGVADTYEVCRKDAGDAYAWVSIF